jgi:hypothetical protein
VATASASLRRIASREPIRWPNAVRSRAQPSLRSIQFLAEQVLLGHEDA